MKSQVFSNLFRCFTKAEYMLKFWLVFNFSFISVYPVVVNENFFKDVWWKIFSLILSKQDKRSPSLIVINFRIVDICPTYLLCSKSGPPLVASLAFLNCISKSFCYNSNYISSSKIIKIGFSYCYFNLEVCITYLMITVIFTENQFNILLRVA